jgi:hypothetical protein
VSTIHEWVRDELSSGVFSGIQVAYLATERNLGVLIEIFSGSPNAEEA